MDFSNSSTRRRKAFRRKLLDWIRITRSPGARVFNAAVFLGVPVAEIARHFDSITFCLSKGLGSPVGSLICGNQSFIEKARRLRKMVGGGMRQAGVLAAAGLYALEHCVTRLKEDHQNAAYLSQELSKISYLHGKIQVHTNMVFINVGLEGYTALSQFLHSKGIIIWGGETLRLVTHLDVTQKGIETVILAFKEFYSFHIEKENQEVEIKKAIY